MVMVQLRRRTGWPRRSISKYLRARSKTPVWWARGTGPCHSMKLMPTSNSRDQSAWEVTMPASM